MPEIRTIRVRIPGQWRDAWLYKEQLLLWDRQGYAASVPLMAISRAAAKLLSPEASLLLDHLIFRNDWKASEPFRRFMGIDAVASVLTRDYGEDRSEIDLVLEDLAIEPFNIEQVPGIALDTHVYANRVYVGSTEGLYEWHFRPGAPEQDSPTLQRLSFRVSNVGAGYGSVNASSEDHGLWFQRLSFDDEWSWRNGSERMRQVSDESVTTSFVGWHLLNYTSEPVPRFLRAHVERLRPHDRAVYEAAQVQGYEAEQGIHDLTVAAIANSGYIASDPSPKLQADEDDLSVLGNSRYRLLAYWHSHLHVVNLAAYDRKPITAKRNTKFRGATRSHLRPEDALSTQAIGSGFLVELFDQVIVFTENGSHTLFNGVAGRIRTFPDSKRHRDAAVITTENELNLIGFIEL